MFDEDGYPLMLPDLNEPLPPVTESHADLLEEKSQAEIVLAELRIDYNCQNLLLVMNMQERALRCLPRARAEILAKSDVLINTRKQELHEKMNEEEWRIATINGKIRRLEIQPK
jgi:hypothetical protein